MRRRNVLALILTLVLLLLYFDKSVADLLGDLRVSHEERVLRAHGKEAGSDTSSGLPDIKGE